MKICYLGNAKSIHIKRWIKYFADKGNEVHLISLRPEGSNDFGKVKLHLIKKIKHAPTFTSHLLNFLPVLYQMKMLIKKIKPDILHAHCVGGYGWLGALSGFHPLIITAWGSDVLIDPKSKIKRPLIKFALKKADLITCDGDHMREAMIKLGADSSKIQIIYFGIDTKKFSPGSKNENLIRKLKIQNCPIVTSLRNLEPIYDVETLIKAIPLVLKEIPNVKFIIIGEGSQREYLMNLAKSLNVFDTIRFVGQIPNNEVPRYLNLADVYVSTSLSDSTSVSLLEAMACGLTPIVTDVGENRKILKDGKQDFLIPVKNPKILAKRIIYLLINKEFREKIGRFNRKIIQEKYDYYKEMAKLEKIYRELTEGKL
jgi:glycosyltransferase involved in cell wall biosynthesis